MAENGAPVLEARGISRRFGALTVLEGVDLSVRRGEAVGIVGPNGAGKTTLLNILAGSLRPTAGVVRLRDEDVTRISAERRSRLGIGRAHQIPRPFGAMTVFENVLVGASTGGGRRGADAAGHAIDVLEQCGLLELANRRAEALGLMHRKRLELARAIATGPTVLLLDEIGGGLTDDEAVGLVDTVRELRDGGTAIVWIEHVVRLLVQVTERLVCLDAGRVIAEGEPHAVMRDTSVVDAYLGGASGL